MLSSHGRILTAILLAAGVGLTLPGCGGGSSHPMVLPSIGAAGSPTPKASPGASEPHHRPLSERQAAIAVVRRYYQVLNTLHRSMNADALASQFTASCPCREQVRSIRSAAARGEHYVDRASINVMRPSVQDARHAYVLVNLDTARGGLVTADGKRLTTSAAQHGVQRVFRLVRRQGRWLISRIEAG